MNNQKNTTINCSDDNIEILRQRYPNGLHFAVGDLHGEVTALVDLLEKIRFCPDKDFIYFVGDYNEGGNPQRLLGYMSNYFHEDNEAPGFHMIRGNHERELSPLFALENLPDIFVIRCKNLNFYIAHAGMVSRAFDLINKDIDNEPGKKVFTYRLENQTCCYNALLRQLVWSLFGLYSQRSHWHQWPTEDKLAERRACIIHGHTPYCFFTKQGAKSYGDNNLFWENQHVWFCEELHSFNIDSNIKGRYENGESYRGLSCLCFEVYDELAASGNGILTVDAIREAENGIFSIELNHSPRNLQIGNIDLILNARPAMKSITLNSDGIPVMAK